MSVAKLLIYLSKLLLGQNQTKQKRKTKKNNSNVPPRPTKKNIKDHTVPTTCSTVFLKTFHPLMSAVTNSTWTTLSFVNEAASSSSTTTSFVTLKWKCFKMVCSHVEEEPVLQELTGVVIPTKPRMSDWIYTPASSGRGKHLHWGYCQICCIALRILQTSKEFWVFLFRQSSWQTS